MATTVPTVINDTPPIRYLRCLSDSATTKLGPVDFMAMLDSKDQREDSPRGKQVTIDLSDQKGSRYPKEIRQEEIKK